MTTITTTTTTTTTTNACIFTVWSRVLSCAQTNKLTSVVPKSFLLVSCRKLTGSSACTRTDFFSRLCTPNVKINTQCCQFTELRITVTCSDTIYAGKSFNNKRKHIQQSILLLLMAWPWHSTKLVVQTLSEHGCNFAVILRWTVTSVHVWIKQVTMSLFIATAEVQL